MNKQLNDKERVHAALENPTLRKVIDNGVRGGWAGLCKRAGREVGAATSGSV